MGSSSRCCCNYSDLCRETLRPPHSSLDLQNLLFRALATAVTRTLQQLPSREAQIYKIHAIAERAIWQPP